MSLCKKKEQKAAQELYFNRGFGKLFDSKWALMNWYCASPQSNVTKKISGVDVYRAIDEIKAFAVSSLSYLRALQDQEE